LITERRYIDSDTRVGVPVPRTTYAIGVINHQEVGKSRLHQANARPDAGKSSSYDNYLVITVGLAIHSCISPF
jgi:hypothetical protein